MKVANAYRPKLSRSQSYPCRGEFLRKFNNILAIHDTSYLPYHDMSHMTIYEGHWVTGGFGAPTNRSNQRSVVARQAAAHGDSGELFTNHAARAKKHQTGAAFISHRFLVVAVI